MQKIQILFPEPQMRRLRELARREDRPVSEVVRRVTEAWLDRCALTHIGTKSRVIPTFHGGETLIAAGVTRFYTRNAKDFQPFAFFEVVSPEA